MPSGRETHFTPKGVSIAADPLAINIQLLRGCGISFSFGIRSVVLPLEVKLITTVLHSVGAKCL